MFNIKISKNNNKIMSSLNFVNFSDFKLRAKLLLGKFIAENVLNLPLTHLFSLWLNDLLSPSLFCINPKKIHKLDTPFYIQYSSLDDISEICFKGLAFIDNIGGKSRQFNHTENKCIKGKFDTFSGINLPNNNLELNLKSDKFTKFNDDIVLILFLLILILNIDKKFFLKEAKLFLPILLSVLIIFYISKYDNWFNIFNLYSFYFFGFEGGDASTYINFTSDIFQSFLYGNFIDFIRGGENVFHYMPGLRYFLFLNQVISGFLLFIFFHDIFSA